MQKRYYVYILASRRNGTLYIGMTSDLIKRVCEHKDKSVKGFTSKYGIDKLVYFEEFSDPENAIKREKRLKNWKRKWKLDLIEKNNPGWKDLYEEILSGFCGQTAE
ncbi:MAG: GIY-YIG nuclease family protein [Candidatus Omnitrophota bacterium]